MFNRIYLNIDVREPYFGLKRWHIDAIYYNVSREWIDTLSAMWMKGEPITVSFWWRRQWCTGKAYVIRVSVEAGFFAPNVTLQLMGTHELKKGSIWL